MKRLYLCILFVVLLTIINGKGNPNKKIISVSSGTSFGMCLGYCRRSINITSKPYELTALKEPNYAQDEYPIVKKTNPFSSNEWKDLIKLINLKAFKALNEQIGCPDCADGGAEWIQINWSNNNKRVTFENGKALEGFEGLVDQLRKLREQYINQL
jgi:hypothetical protein